VNFVVIGWQVVLLLTSVGWAWKCCCQPGDYYYWATATRIFGCFLGSMCKAKYCNKLYHHS